MWACGYAGRVGSDAVFEIASTRDSITTYCDGRLAGTLLAWTQLAGTMACGGGDLVAVMALTDVPSGPPLPTF